MRIALLLFAFTPALAFAQVVITEVMYDVSGSDTDREWIEVYNASAGAVDFTAYKFFEANANHGIATTTIGQDSFLSAGAIAVIVDNVAKFLADWPSFSGVLFDSSFSLSNSGEALAIKDKEGNIIDSLTYDVSLGAAGDGNSLQKGNSGWIAAAPTPGGYAAPSPTPSPSPAAPSLPTPSSSPTPPPPPPDVLWKEPPPKMTVRIKGPSTVIVGSDAYFEAEAFGLKNEPIGNARFVWNFGDGGTAEGKKTAHRFLAPGGHIVYVDASSGEISAGSRLVVEAMPSPIAITAALPGEGGYLELSNSAATDIDVSLWILQSRNGRFIIPRNTYLLPKKKTPFPNAVTKLLFEAPGEVALLYPNEIFAAGFNASPEVLAPPETLLRNKISSQEVVQSAASQREEPPARFAEEETDGQMAAAEVALSHVNETKEGGEMWKWLIALGALLGTAAAGAYMHGREEGLNRSAAPSGCPTARLERDLVERGSGYAITEEKDPLT